MEDSQQQQQYETAIYTEPAVDVTMEMMSPNTTAMLAGMHLDVNVSIGSSSGNHDDCRGSGDNCNSNYRDNDEDHRGRRPLQTIQPHQQHHHHHQQNYYQQQQQRQRNFPSNESENHNNSAPENSKNNNSHPATKTTKNDTATTQSSQKTQQTQRNKSQIEQTYHRDYDAFVTKTITHYCTRIQSNLSSLPEYKNMKEDERKERMREVDLILARFDSAGHLKRGENEGDDVGVEGNYSRGVGWNYSRGVGCNDNGILETTLHKNWNDNNASVYSAGSATTMGDNQQQQLQNTHELHQRSNQRESIGSETTLGEHKQQQNDPNDTTLASAFSASLLEESMILLSEDEGRKHANDDDDDNDEEEGSRFSGGTSEENKSQQRQRLPNNNHSHPAISSPSYNRSHQQRLDSSSVSSIEKTRHCQLLSPQYSTHGKQAIKRCASNSGKRGSKSRYRSSIDHGDLDHDGFPYGEDGFGDHRECEGDEDDRGFGGVGGLFINDHDGGFSCGSPIVRRFSEDGLGLGEDENDFDDDHDSVDERGVIVGELHQSRMQSSKRMDKSKNSKSRSNAGNESEEESRFSQVHDYDPIDFGGDNDYYDDDDDDGGGDFGGNWTVSELRRQQPYTQQSQWSAFRNADPKLTYSQMDSEDEEDSPVRKRAIRFEGSSQSQQRSVAKSSSRFGKHIDSVKKSNRKPIFEEKEEEIERSETEEDGDEDAVFAMEERMADMSMDDDQQAANPSNINDEDPVQTVRNLCRRAKELEKQGIDTSLLDEVAPTDIRLKDGAHFRMDPLPCRQGNEKSNNNKSKSTKKKKPQHGKKPVKTSKSKDDEKKSKAGGKRETSNRVRAYSSSDDSSISEQDVSFQDPIGSFPSRVAGRLNLGCEFLLIKENLRRPEDIDDYGESCAAVLSMTRSQIKAVVSKLMIQTITSSRRHQRLHNGSSKTFGSRLTPSRGIIPTTDCRAGGTLIVLREKSQLCEWEAALREYTSLSVINHAGIQSNLRKLASTASKCAGFDVVLTTYDSLKAKEVTIPIDCYGRAKLSRSTGESANDNGDGGWMTARTSGTQSGASQPQKCHQFTVLHRMSWYRVIMLDELGKNKGYATKQKTQRANAVVSVHSQSRFIFFEKEEDTTSTAMEDKFKDDSSRLRAVATALHIPEETKLSKLLSDFVIDVNKAGRSMERKAHHSSSSASSCDEISESSDDEHLTDPY